MKKLTRKQKTVRFIVGKILEIEGSTSKSKMAEIRTLLDVIDYIVGEGE